MNRSEKINYMAKMAILIALTVALQFFSNYISFGTVNINLALIVICVGACLMGPITGLLLGVVDGIIIILAPSTLAYFFPVNPFMTIVLCLVKTGVAGLVCGLVYKLLKNKNEIVGTIAGSVLTPIVNTGIFLLGAFLFFFSVYGNSGEDLIVGTLTINFLIEFIVISALSPAVYKIIQILSKKGQNQE